MGHWLNEISIFLAMNGCARLVQGDTLPWGRLVMAFPCVSDMLCGFFWVLTPQFCGYCTQQPSCEANYKLALGYSVEKTPKRQPGTGWWLLLPHCPLGDWGPQPCVFTKHVVHVALQRLVELADTLEGVSSSPAGLDSSLLWLLWVWGRWINYSEC